MGREVRLVKAGWEHPKSADRDGYQPQMPGNYYAGALKDYETELADYTKEDEAEYGSFEEYWGGKPDKKWYMPVWSDDELTHMQMYEDTSEGTPISPVFRRDQAEEMAQWLSDNGASSMGRMTSSKEAWLKMIEGGGFAVSMVMSNGIMKSGVDAL